jgi:thiol-disulfide isomerase/thioredoxin
MRALLAALAVTLALPAAADEVEPEAVGEGLPAPNFALRTLNPDASGTSWLALDRYVGEDPEDGGARLVVLSFFASWCGTCERELGFLERLHQTYRAQGLRVVAVCADADDPGVALARKLVAKHRVTFPVLSDRASVLARRYLGDDAPLPSVVLVGKDGVVLRIERGYARDASQFLLADVQAGLGLLPVARPRPPPSDVDARPASAGPAR